MLYFLEQAFIVYLVPNKQECLNKKKTILNYIEVSFIVVVITVFLVGCSASKGLEKKNDDVEKNRDPFSSVIESLEERLEMVNNLLVLYKQTNSTDALYLAEIFNSETHKSLLRWGGEATLSLSKNSELDPYKVSFLIEAIQTIVTAYSQRICGNNNSIAEAFVKAGETGRAIKLYKKVIREFDSEEYKGCFTEAEIAIRILIERGNKVPKSTPNFEKLPPKKYIF